MAPRTNCDACVCESEMGGWGGWEGGRGSRRGGVNGWRRGGREEERRQGERARGTFRRTDRGGRIHSRKGRGGGGFRKQRRPFRVLARTQRPPSRTNHSDSDAHAHRLSTARRRHARKPGTCAHTHGHARAHTQLPRERFDSVPVFALPRPPPLRSPPACVMKDTELDKL